MKKTVLVLEQMPQKCSECVLSTKKNDEWVCAGYEIKVYVDFNGSERHKYCPLEEVNITEE